MDYRITQCPRCGTSFRVTDAHLAVAAGAVRCGSCLHIFNARDFWVEEKAPEAEAAPTTVLRADQIDDDTLIDDDLLIDDDTPLFGDTDEEPAQRPIYNASDSDLLDDPDARVGGFSPGFLDENGWEPELKSDFGAEEAFGEDATAGDESWAEKLLEEDPLETTADLPPATDRFSEFDDILSQAPQTEEEEDYERPLKPHERDDDLEISPEFLELVSSAPRRDNNTSSSDELYSNTANPEPETIELEPMRADDRFGSAGARVGDSDRGRNLFGGFEPEPLQLHQFVREPRWPRVLWMLGLVAALALLAFQYLHFNFDRLARGEHRALLASLCGVVGCALPAQQELGAIRTSSLIVRSHPTSRGALAVDAILTNTADFSQPYPHLLLQFTDLNGEPVAGRLFTPEEYLGGELTGTRLMPMQQPVHIGLEVVDPGPSAVNYQLVVSPPD